MRLRYAIAVAAGVAIGVGAGAWAAWSPYAPVNTALSGANYVQIYPPAKNTTQTFAPVGSLAKYTIGTLPACAAAKQGMRVFVTDGATSPTYLATVSTTGAVVVPVFCDGTNWIYN